jgi:hypothetical protein
MSTRETGFQMELLKKFDAEILIGQVSYKQRADIYNYVFKYDEQESPDPDDTASSR